MMKKSLILIYLLIGITGRIFSYTDNSKVETDSLYRHHMVQLKQCDWQTQEMQLRIISNTNGRLVYSEQLNGPLGITNRNILSNLLDGHYKMEVKDDLRFFAQDIFVIQQKLWIPKDETIEIFKPVVKRKGRFLQVSMLLEQAGIKLKLLSEDGKTKSEITFNHEDLELRKIDLRNLKSGQYTLVISIGGQSFLKNFAV